MQGVMSVSTLRPVMGATSDFPHLASSPAQPPAGSSTRHSQTLVLKSALIGRQLTRPDAIRLCSSVQEASGKKNFQVRAGKGGVNVQNLLSGILHLPGKETDAVVYKGVVTIAKKRVAASNLLSSDLVDIGAATADKAADSLGQKIEIQLVSVDLDPAKKSPKLSAASVVEGWLTNLGDMDLVADDDQYQIQFKVPKNFGEIGAFVIKNNHPNEFFLKNLSLEGPNKSKVLFNTLAWIHPHQKYAKNRVFFPSKKYITAETPEGLKALREQELEQIRGDGKGQRERWDRIYDYDVYNDYGNPDKDISQKRAVLGGKENPYPRRNRTGRPKSKADPDSESRLDFYLEVPYIPSDEFFVRTKNSTFISTFLKGVGHSVLPQIKASAGKEQNFKNVGEIDQLYKNGLPIRIAPSILSTDSTPDLSGQKGSMVYLAQFFAPKGNNQSVVVYPVPDVIKHDAKAWLTDEEFGRQTLAGLHPTVIKAVTEYPPKGETALTDDHILPYLEGLSVAEAIQKKKLFTIDYRDALLDLVAIANADTKTGFKTYSPRAIFFHTKNGKIMPVAIELSLPPTEKGAKTVDRVFTPADDADHLWSLAKIHFAAVDSNYHQVYSHFTETHAVMEPFIIATRRHISALHPVFPLLVPHFKDTLNINSAAREILIASEGVIETSFSFGPHAMLAGAKAYGAFWRFDHLSPPRDLIDRGIAVPADESHPGGVKLVFEDYPMARDSLDLWDALYKWAESYLNIVYKGSDDAVKSDQEIQAWWNEVKNVGHADHKDASWWPKVDSIKSLADVIASIAFVAGPFHAAVNFGQWAYGGYPLNKPTGTRRFIPEKDSAEYKELQQNPEKFLLSTIGSPSQATTVMTVLEMLASHSVDEEYIGSQSLSADFHSTPELAAAFEKFSDSIKKVEADIKARNNDKSLVNRFGPAQVPYTLLSPTSGAGLTGKGVPYSISI